MFKKTVLSLLIFCLPFQLGYHFWPPQSFVSSFRLDYLSPTLYLVDLLIFLYAILQPRVSWQSFSAIFTTKTGVLFLILVVTNLASASGNPITLIAWLRLLEYYLLFQILRRQPNIVEKIKVPFLLSLVVILVLALLQFLRQSSLGGLFYYLGERPLSLSLSNIAKIDFPWGKLLRPYSTFSHPNSLAGYLLIIFILLPFFSRSKILKGFVVTVIILTFSKSAILTLILIGIFRLNLIQSLVTAIFLSLTPLIPFATNLPSWLSFSFVPRQHLLLLSFQIIKNHLLFGVGLRQFIPSLATIIPGNQLSYSTLQPVHNLLLLIVSELGLVPLLILFVKAKYILLNTKYYPLATIILLTGSLDHYWWTLPQNQLIIVLALALFSNRSNRSY